MVISAIQHSIMQIAPSQSVNDPSFSSNKWGDRIQIADALSREYNGSDRNRAQKVPGIYSMDTSSKETLMYGRLYQILIFL